MKSCEDKVSHDLTAPVNGNGMSESFLQTEASEAGRDFLPHLRLLWSHRSLIFRAAIYSALASVIVAFLIPVRFQSTARLMPPDSLSASGLGMMAAMAGRAGADGIGGLASDLFGRKEFRGALRGNLGQ